MPRAKPKGAGPQPLTLSPDEIAREMALCSADPCYFINQYCFILVRADDGSRTVEKFILWEYQAKLVAAFAKGGHYIILKARQLGITTVVSAYLTWFALFRPNSYLLVLSKREDEAQKLLERVKVTYERLPDWLQACCPKGETWNSVTATFQNGSKVESMAATEGTGRSDTASVVFIDEADYVPDLRATYQAAKPTVDGPGGQMILASTSQGPIRYFKELWDTAMQRKGKLRAVFFPWQVRPGRTEEWLLAETADYAEQQRKREYPAKWQEAFTSAEALVYPAFDSAIHMETMRWDAKKGVVHTSRYGDLAIRYFMAGEDFNMAVPGCTLIGGVTPDGTVVIVDGYYAAEISVASEDPDQLTWAKIDYAFWQTYRYQKIWCDHNPDNILALQRKNLPAVKAIKDVDAGISLVAGALNMRAATLPDGTPIQRPGLIINADLAFIVNEFYSYKRRKVHDIITDLVVKENDHALDALRYLCQGLLRGQAKITVI